MGPNCHSALGAMDIEIHHWWQLVYLSFVSFLKKNAKRAKCFWCLSLFASRLNGNLLLFSFLFGDATASLKHFFFFAFFFICSLMLGNNAHTRACIFNPFGTTRRVYFLKKEARMGSRRNVLKNMFQSMLHPHKWEGNQRSLPQKQLAQFYPEPLHLRASKFHNWENKMCCLFNMDPVKPGYF